jgi:hypothetical protein
MKNNNLQDIISQALIVNKKRAIPLTYKEFKENIEVIKCILGNKGIVMFSEKTAALCLDINTQIRFIITGKKKLSNSDFNNLGLELSMIGPKHTDIKNPIITFVDDVINNIYTIIIVTVIYYIVYFNNQGNFDNIIKLNDSMLNIISIFIASLLVFIGFFYTDKERIITSYKKGLYDKLFMTDLYVFKLSLLALLLILASTGTSSLLYSNIITNQTIMKHLNEAMFECIKFKIVFVLTYVSIVMMIIGFDSIINYYLKKIRNNYFMDAFEDVIENDPRKS